MHDKRSKKRHQVRLQVEYRARVDDPVKRGVTENISEGGMFIRSFVIVPARTYMKIELTTPENENVVVIGQVRWVKRVAPAMARLGHQGGMGIRIRRFLSGMDRYLQLCRRLIERST